MTIRTATLLITISTLLVCALGDVARSRATARVAPSPRPASTVAPPAHDGFRYRPLIAQRVISTPPGAEVVRRGAVLGETPLELELSRSDQPVTFTLRLAGHLEQTFAIVPDEPDTTYVVLQPAPTVVAPEVP